MLFIRARRSSAHLMIAEVIAYRRPASMTAPRFLVCFSCPSPHANTHIPPSPSVSSARAACVDLDPQRPSHLLLICLHALWFINHALTPSYVSLWLKRGEEEVGEVTAFVLMLHCIAYWILIHFDLQSMCLFAHGDLFFFPWWRVI